MERLSRRREMDFMKLMNGPQKVYPSDNVSEFWVEFRGPEGTPYEDGVWVIHVHLPSEYPFKSPSIGFGNPIYHPNVEEASGSICLNVINQTWTPMYELMNIFEVFLPQLLRYPNPSDPLNADAASNLLRDAISYVSIVREHVSKHATREAAVGSIPLQFQPNAEAIPKNGKIQPSSEEELTAISKSSTDASRSLFESEEEYKPEEIEI